MLNIYSAQEGDNAWRNNTKHLAWVRRTLTLDIREQTDGGQPTVIASPRSEAAGIYRDMARKLAARVTNLPRDLSAKFPAIVVQAS